MKTLNLSIAALAAVLTLGLTGCKNAETPSAEGENATEASAPKGAIVYFNLDRVLSEYDMANDLRSVVETKVQGISDEINRRGTFCCRGAEPAAPAASERVPELL